MSKVIGNRWLLATLLALGGNLAASESQAGPLLDWLTGWFNGSASARTTAGYYPNAYPASGYYPTTAFRPTYQPYPSQVGTLGTQMVGYAPAGALSHTAYSPVAAAGMPHTAFSPIANTAAPHMAFSPFAGQQVPHTAFNPVAGCGVCPTAAAAPVAAFQPCTQQTFRQQVVNFMPQTHFRTAWRRIPVTNFRPVMATDPVTGCPVTVMQPCVTHTWQAARVPVHFRRPIVSTVPVGPCTPCVPGGMLAPSHAAPAAVPYYGAPATAAPGAITTPGITTVPAVPGAVTVPGQRVIQPADVRPSLVPSPGLPPDIGVGGRVNYPPVDAQVQPAAPQTQSPAPQTQPPAGVGSQYQPATPQSFVRPQSAPRGSWPEANSPSPAGGVDHNLRPIPRLETDSAPRQPATGAPDLLDPRDRTASRHRHPWGYTLTAWPEAKKAEPAEAPPSATRSPVPPPAGDEPAMELTAPIQSRPVKPSATLKPESWDDSGWHSAR